MPPKKEKSHLKRGRANAVDQPQDSKKPRRSQRIAQSQSGLGATYTPSPVTNRGPTGPEVYKETAVTPPVTGRPSQFRHHTPVRDAVRGPSSPPGDTQALSQYPPSAFGGGVVDEAEEGVWGYLFPLDNKFGESLVLRKRDSGTSPAHPAHRNSSRRGAGNTGNTSPSDHRGGYLVGRHPECDFILDIPTISNRHCLIFNESRKDNFVAILEDLSTNGTFINEAIVGRNKRRELDDGDDVTILDEARFVFRYPRSRATGGFRQKYRILQQLGKGHFATVFRCVEMATGVNYAVKRFEKPQGNSQRHDSEGLQQEIAVLMGVHHPNVLSLIDTFDEADAVYLVLELAPEGELFNWIVSNEKLSEAETRKVFRQLFHGLKYLHERNIVHRDIKPENILLIDGRLNVKLADFGLAKIIGEDSFTTTLCGTPSYVAPEILENSRQRRYTRAVDVWSLGVVLYICLCGFPPFSDELYSEENPYRLADQIKMGLFNYPSPYWDSVGDPALDLIDRMLTVDPDRRITIDECLEHPWLTQKYPSVADSTDGLTGAFGQLDFSRRKVGRERTLLSSINDVRVGQVIDEEDQHGHSSQVKIFDKNVAGKRVHNIPARAGAAAGRRRRTTTRGEPSPAANRDPDEFARAGGRGDQILYDGEYDDSNDYDDYNYDYDYNSNPTSRTAADEVARGRRRRYS